MKWILQLLVIKKYMAYEYYNKQPMEMVALNLNMIIDNNPHLINALDRSVNHPLMGKYNNIPYTN